MISLMIHTKYEGGAHCKDICITCWRGFFSCNIATFKSRVDQQRKRCIVLIITRIYIVGNDTSNNNCITIYFIKCILSKHFYILKRLGNVVKPEGYLQCRSRFDINVWYNGNLCEINIILNRLVRLCIFSRYFVKTRFYTWTVFESSRFGMR